MSGVKEFAASACVTCGPSCETGEARVADGGSRRPLSSPSTQADSLGYIASVMSLLVVILAP